MKKSIVLLPVFVVAFLLSSFFSSSLASEKVVGEMKVVVSGQGSVRVEGFILDGVSEEAESGFVSGVLTRGGQIIYLDKKEVSGDFSFGYNFSRYLGWNWSFTLYTDEVDADGRNRALRMKSGRIR